MNSNDKIIERLKESLRNKINELENELLMLVDERKLRSEISKIKDLEALATISTDEIIVYMSKIDSSFTIDSIELEGDIYFYNAGQENEAFKSSPRYIDSSAKLKTIVDKFISFSMIESNIDELKIIDAINTYKNLLESISANNKIFGEVQELSTYLSVFDNTWSDEDKLTVCSMLVKAHIEYLNESRNMYIEVSEEISDEIIEEKADKVALMMEARMLENELNAIVEDEHQIDVSQETSQQVESLKTFLRNIESSLSFKKVSSNSEKLYSNLFGELEKNNISIDVIKQSFIPSDFIKFLVYSLKQKVAEIEAFMSESYSSEDTEEAKSIINDLLKDCSSYVSMISKEKAEIDDLNSSDDIELEKPITLLFYTSGSGESEFEKSLKSCPSEKIDEVSVLLTKLQQNNIQNAVMLAKDNDSRLKSLNSANLFITFKVLPHNHILVYHVAEKLDINKKVTTNKLRAYVTSIEDDVVRIINDGVSMPEGSIEYRKLLEENKVKLRIIKEKITGVEKR